MFSRPVFLFYFFNTSCQSCVFSRKHKHFKFYNLLPSSSAVLVAIIVYFGVGSCRAGVISGLRRTIIMHSFGARTKYYSTHSVTSLPNIHVTSYLLTNHYQAQQYMILPAQLYDMGYVIRVAKTEKLINNAVQAWLEGTCVTGAELLVHLEYTIERFVCRQWI